MEESAAIIPRSRVRNIAIPKIPTMIANEFGSAEDRQKNKKSSKKLQLALLKNIKNKSLKKLSTQIEIDDLLLKRGTISAGFKSDNAQNVNDDNEDFYKEHPSLEEYDELQILSARNNELPENLVRAEELILYAKNKEKIISSRSEIISYKRGYTSHEFFIQSIDERIILEYKPLLTFFFPKNGITILENELNKTEIRHSIVKRGLRRIYEFNPHYLNQKEKLTKSEDSIKRIMLSPIFKELEQARLKKCSMVLEIYSVRKVIGFDVSVAYDFLTKGWILSVQTYSVIIRGKKDLELVYTQNSDINILIRRFAKYWIVVLDYLNEHHLYNDFINDIRGHTLVGTMVGSPVYWELVKYKKEVVFFHSLIQNNCIDYFVEIFTTYKLLIKYNLYYCPIKIIDKLTFPADFRSAQNGGSPTKEGSPKRKIKLLTVDQLDKLFIKLLDLYHSERAQPLSKGERGVIVHIYSTLIKEKDESEVLVHLPKKLKKEGEDKFDKIAKEYMSKPNDAEHNNKEVIEAFKHKFNMDEKKGSKHLLTVFQIKNNEFNFFHLLTESLTDFVKDICKEEITLFGYNHENYVNNFKLKVEKYIDRDELKSKTPFNTVFYEDIIENCYKEALKRGRDIYYSIQFKKRLLEIITDSVKQMQLKHKIVYPGFTSHLFISLGFKLINIGNKLPDKNSADDQIVSQSQHLNSILNQGSPLKNNPALQIIEELENKSSNNVSEDFAQSKSSRNSLSNKTGSNSGSADSNDNVKEKDEANNNEDADSKSNASEASESHLQANNNNTAFEGEKISPIKQRNFSTDGNMNETDLLKILANNKDTLNTGSICLNGKKSSLGNMNLDLLSNLNRKTEVERRRSFFPNDNNIVKEENEEEEERSSPKMIKSKHIAKNKSLELEVSKKFSMQKNDEFTITNKFIKIELSNSKNNTINPDLKRDNNTKSVIEDKPRDKLAADTLQINSIKPPVPKSNNKRTSCCFIY